ncbi:MAG: polyphosphate kinase 1 [Zetaproteobacteria bacterium CG12_big_fil_rev_8_21_14_0_65_54_13]|nr:MAG: polyphosphate kinase 1 [Zetaproteobacteria bacterium CG12_big_fil_rev_8_21_14_0_65_54_13]PIX55937.1 MAG: polyphosphate kinase 1 [Zetaproteobacteria bacterium CG_4_10_14_3_um_filter_54_28]PJA30641.1 MAG: polyphosphate kinase 1 [Zetaproteobacteria bacterium CG_4_9_14_3_um_filter_54_145]
MKVETSLSLDSPELYLNRDLSMLAFNRRVLEMASDPDIPLLERLRFLCICTSNMDEFFEVRVAIQKQWVAVGSTHAGADGLSASEVLRRIREKVTELVSDQYQLLNDELLPALREEGISFLHRAEWNEAQQNWIRCFFNRELLPVLTPIGLDPAHPFPRLLNKILNFMVALEGKDAFGRESHYAIVQAPRSLPRMIRLPADVATSENCYVFLSAIIHAHVGELFPGMNAKFCHQFRITRNSELDVDDELVDLKQAIAGELLERRFSQAVRLEVSNKCPTELSDFLLEKFGLNDVDLYRVEGPVNPYRMALVCDQVDRPDLKFPVFEQAMPSRLQVEDRDLFKIISDGDLLLHHPYHRFSPVVELLMQAATDPHVLAIKQTLYRVVPDSPIVDALVKAARANKEVVAVIELRARFNEEDNIALADRLSAAGVQVVYGVVGYKTHCKMMLIVRREGRSLRRYVHLGTGNYHTITTRFYTDFGILSRDPDLGEDVHRIFQQLTGMGRVSKLKTMLQAPFSLHSGLLERIGLEAANAAAGGKGRIIAKMNGLEETEIIQALYRASQAGVKIDLIVRGICCLKPGIKGVSENIRVRSVLGRFLEHTRVFYFYNGGEPEVLCASADWMGRNLLRRVETCFPVRDKKLARDVLNQGLRPFLVDNTGAWNLRKDGAYYRVRSQNKPRCAQLEMMRLYGNLKA